MHWKRTNYLYFVLRWRRMADLMLVVLWIESSQNSFCCCCCCFKRNDDMVAQRKKKTKKKTKKKLNIKDFRFKMLRMCQFAKCTREESFSSSSMAQMFSTRQGVPQLVWRMSEASCCWWYCLACGDISMLYFVALNCQFTCPKSKNDSTWFLTRFTSGRGGL